MKNIIVGLIALVYASSLFSAQVTLEWKDNSSNEQGFKVERATGAGGSFAQIGTTPPNISTYVDSTVIGGTEYRYRVRAYNEVGDSDFTNTATVTPPNQAPTISAITDRTIAAGANTGAIAFTVGDAETAVGSLTLSATSSNTTLVPVANIVFGGTGANRTVTVTPAAGRIGIVVITVTVRDGTNSTDEAFSLTVGSAPSDPTELVVEVN